jgi:small-conductance mechanosensitive channel
MQQSFAGECSGVAARWTWGHHMSDLRSGYTDLDKREDVQVLHSMGYAQELERRMSRFSNFAISFSIICILSGGINSLAQATAGAGGAAIGIGWPLGCLISGLFALAMARSARRSPPPAGSTTGARSWGTASPAG